MDTSYSIDIEPPMGWTSERLSGSSLMLQPASPERFASDGLVPSVLVVADAAGRGVELIGTLVAQVERDLGDGTFRSSVSVGADASVAFFQVVSRTRVGQQELVVTATACHSQAGAVADVFDRLCSEPVSFEVVEESG